MSPGRRAVSRIGGDGGGLLGEYGWTYTVAKTDDGWRILSILGHDPALAVRCP